MKKVIFFAASFLSIAACNKEVISTPEMGTGVLMLSVESDDRVSVKTKADPVFDVNTADFNVTIVNDENVVKKSGKPADLSVVVLPADNYVIKAENITENEALSNNGGKGQLRMAGQCDQFSLAQGQTVTKTVSCVPANSKITVAFDASFNNAFRTVNVDFDQTLGGNRDFTAVAAGAEYFYNVVSNTTVEVKLTATSNADVNVTHTQRINMEVGYHYAVTYSATADGQLNVVIQASDDLIQSNVNIPVNPYQPAA